MPGYYELKFPDASLNSKYAGMRGNYYELPDGSLVALKSTPCWCKDCNQVTDGEWIESVEELERRLQDLQDPQSERFQFHDEGQQIIQNIIPEFEGIGLREKALERSSERLRWRRLRKALPKCIVCGSSSIFFPDESNDGAVVVDCKVVVHIKIRGMCSTKFNEWYFTVDGDRILRDTKPKYWTLPTDAT